MNERRQDGAGARRLRGHLGRAEEEAADPGAGAADEVRDPVAVVGVRGADEAAVAAGDKGRRGLRAAVVGADGDDGAEHLVRVEGLTREWLWCAAHDRADEVARAGGDADRRDLAGATEHALGLGRCGHGV